MAELGQGPSSALDSTYGAMLIGVLFATFFQGLLTVQTYNYFENFPKDPIWNKIIVTVVWCLDSFHLGLICQAAYHYLVRNWGYAPALATSTWELDLQLTFIGLSSFVCQLFFLNRIWVFSRRNYFVVGFIFAICVTTLVLDILVTIRIISNPSVTEFGRRKGEIIGVFTSGAAADVLIAGFLCFYLKRDQSAFERTKSIVGTVVQYAVATGIFTSALALGSIVAVGFLFTWTASFISAYAIYFLKQDGFYFIAMHFNLGRMYTNALLATLNARGKMRMALQSGQTSTSDRKGGAGFVQSRDTGSRYIPPFEKIQKDQTSSSDRPPFSYTIERITDGDIELDQVNRGKTSAWS